MSTSSANNPDREKMQHILASIGSKSGEISEQIEAVDYDWQQPHCFSTIQLKRLVDFTEKLAQACAENFTKLYNTNYNVETISTTQHFATELFDLNDEKKDYCLAFGTDMEHASGLISIPVQSALSWAAQALGESESEEDSDKKLSQLEESLLVDAAFVLIEAFPKAHEGFDLFPIQKTIQTDMPSDLQGSKELCKISFSATKTDSDESSEFHFLILCDELQLVVGNERQAPTPPAEAIPNALLNHAYTLPVSITVQLASTKVTVAEIMGLNAGDILVFDKKIGEPIELLAEGRVIFQGQPAKSEGKNAILITEICSNK